MKKNLVYSKNHIYRYFYEQKRPLTKQDIYTGLNYSMPTIHQQIRDLLAEKIIQKAEYLESSGGRPALSYRIVPDARLAIGVYWSADKIRILATDLYLQNIAYKSIPIEPDINKDLEALGILLSEELLIFIEENHLPQEKILGLGLVIPAVLNTEKNRIIFGPTIKMKNKDLKPLLNALPQNLNIYIDNDANSGGFAEWYLSGQRKNLAYLSLENGVGGAMLIKGQPYSGDNGRSAEFGHICIHPSGGVCHCGQKGCLEVYCSSATISTDLGIELEDFFIGLEKGHFHDIWFNYLDNLALGIHSIQMMTDSDLVIGGIVSEYMEKWLPILQKKVAELNPFSADGSFIKLCHQPRRLNMMGVCLHFIQDFLASIK